MNKLFEIKKGKSKFWVCKYDNGLYSIDRITKGFGGSVCFFDNLEQVKEYMQINGFKAV